MGERALAREKEREGERAIEREREKERKRERVRANDRFCHIVPFSEPDSELEQPTAAAD
jgi:hypothetical protein